jgi:sialic acid synthase SpsE
LNKYPKNMMKSPNPILDIQGKKIGRDYPTYFIADIAANHDGDLARAKELIYLAADAGADAAKFQHFQAETIVSDKGFRDMGSKQSHQSKWGKSVSEVYKAASVSLNWTEELKKTCEDAGIPFFTTPYSLEVIDELNSHVPAYKIGSGDITWRDMVEKVASQDKPYFLACGASTMDEVIAAVAWALAINPQFGLMQCNTNYTAELENFNFIHLNVLKALREMYPYLVLGLSDHTPKHATALGAVALGASMIEKHFTDDVSRVGPDHAFSMDPQTWRDMVDRTRELELAMGQGVKRVEDNELETVIVQRRSLRAKKSFKAGHVIALGDLVPLRPCPTDAISPAKLREVIGCSLRGDITEGDYLRERDLD